MIAGESLLLLLLVGALSPVMALITWKVGDLRCKAPLIALFLLVGLLSTSYMMELLSPTLDGKLFWNGIEYLSNTFIPVVFLIFSMMFVGRASALSWRNIISLSAIPMATIVIVWSDSQYHDLFYQAALLVGNGHLASYEPTYGPWFYIYIFYSFVLFVYSFIVLLEAYLRSSWMHRKQIRPVMISGVVPIVAFIIGFIDAVPLTLTFVMIVAFIATASLIFLGMFQYELFDVMPLALDSVVENMKDGAVILDKDHRILHLNPSAAAIIGMPQEKAFAGRSSAVLPSLSDEDLERGLASGEMIERSIPRQGREHFYAVQVTALAGQGGHRAGLLLILRDVDEERRMRESLKSVNTRLSVMSMVVRHDTLNQLGIIRGFSELLTTTRPNGEDASRYGERIREAAAFIERQLMFAQEYQLLGRYQPEWQWLQFVLAKAKTTGVAEGLDVEADLGSLSVLADPFLEKVFTILLINTKVHGGHADKVRITYRDDDGGCTVVYQDNGAGIPTARKATLFSEENRPDRGMGLFVANQIMALSGGRISETGEEGSGCRFELYFPPGAWKNERVRVQERDGQQAMV